MYDGGRLARLGFGSIKPETMSDIAIDALRVDLTKLLLSARYFGPVQPEAADKNAQTISLLREYKQKRGAASKKITGGFDVLHDESMASTSSIPVAVKRKSPPPEKVDR